jgi:hypothetical protein
MGMFNLLYKDPSGKEVKGRLLPGKNRTIEFEDGSRMSGSAVYQKLSFLGKISFDGEFHPAKKTTKNHGSWELNPSTGFKIRSHLMKRLQESAKETA